MHKSWIQIDIHTSPKFQELIVGQLINIGFNGFKQDENTLSCYIQKSKWNAKKKQTMKNILDNFESEFPLTVKSISQKTFIEKNWNKEWEKSINIIKPTSKIIIKPNWKKLAARFKNKIVINIDPKMSFGTGHHETTRLCLKLLEKLIKPQMTVLDFGCGSGILGIASIKFGAKSVVAIDNDDWAIKNTKENVKLNKVKNRIRIIHGSISNIPQKKFDLILANLDFHTIVKFFKPLTKKLNNNGIMIISGILENDLNSILTLIRDKSLRIDKILSENEWLAISLIKK